MTANSSRPGARRHADSAFCVAIRVSQPNSGQTRLVEGLSKCCFGAFHPLKQGLGVRDEDAGLGGEPEPAADWLEQGAPVSFSSAASCRDTADGL